VWETGLQGAQAPSKVLISLGKILQNPGKISENLHKLRDSMSKNGGQHLLI